MNRRMKFSGTEQKAMYTTKTMQSPSGNALHGLKEIKSKIWLAL
jgi:hypothetical protein